MLEVDQKFTLGTATPNFRFPAYQAVNEWPLSVRSCHRIPVHSTPGGNPSLNIAEWTPKVIADAAPLARAFPRQDVHWRRVCWIVGKREPVACTKCVQHPAEVSFGSETQHTLRQGYIIDTSDALRQSPTPLRV
jgi:hypothetical protein